MIKIFWLLLFGVTYSSTSYAQSNDTAITQHLKQFWDKYFFDTIMPTLRYKIFKYKNKQIVFFGTQHYNTNINDTIYQQMEQRFNDLAPTIIMSEGSGMVPTSKQDAIRLMGDNGVCTYLGFKSNIRVINWDDLNQNPIYYTLLKKYSNKNIFTVLMAAYLSPYSIRSDSNFEQLYKATVVNWEYEGYPLLPNVKEQKYFFKNYKQLFKKAYIISKEEKIEKKLDFFKNKSFIEVFSLFEQERDLHLLKTITAYLRDHDKIIIQAGLKHLESLETIIPQLLEKEEYFLPLEKHEIINAVNKISFIDTQHIPVFTHIKINKNSVTLFTTDNNHSTINLKNPVYVNIKKEMMNMKPNLILTQGNTPLSATQSLTTKMYGEVGFCRYAGIKKSIRVNSWEPSWNEVYYELLKKYTSVDIYQSLLSWNILKNRNRINNYSSFADFFEMITNHFFFSGYPFQNDQLDAERFLKPVYDSINVILPSDTYGIPIINFDTTKSGVMQMSAKGTYTFKAKAGKYDFTVPIYLPNGKLSSKFQSLSITFFGEPYFGADYLSESTGVLPELRPNIPFVNIIEYLPTLINTEIINDMIKLRTTHLLKVILENKKEFNKIFVQADEVYIRSILPALKQNIDK